jgi:16S rRNA (cytidine1402-2'-O)-methyltransferase
VKQGKLYVIGTPIGNLDDLSPRARRALEECDVLFCEDTRHTGKLLQHCGIAKKQLDSFHDHNEREKVDRALELLAEGRTIGLVSDAGLPLLSDPGFPLLREARARGIVVEPIPGPFAAALALVASGIAPLPFGFFGFVPNKSGERLEFYRDLLQRGMTAIVYESPHRILESLEDAAAVFAETQMTLAREMTKMHEEFLHGSVPEVLAEMKSRDAIYGEITLVFALGETARRAAAVSHEELAAEFTRLRDSGMRRPDALKVLAEKYKLNKRELYKLLE